MSPAGRSIHFLPQPKKADFLGRESQLQASTFHHLEHTRSQLPSLPETIHLVRESLPKGDQAYHLEIGDRTIHICAESEAGWFYGLGTLKQIAGQCPEALPQCHILDDPDFSRRGMMLDVSRNKVPRLETLFELIERFAAWKVNELQLYIEHTFCYEGHETVWKDASPFTREDIHQLDTFCRERFIELVPNLNCFGHMHRWLIHDAYRPLAEQPGGGHTDFGYREEPQGLCATDPGSIALAGDLIHQMTACFHSRQVNVGCDETIDLGYGRSKDAVKKKGRGRVYLEYLRKIHGICAGKGLRMQFWADILLRYPGLLAEIPKDCIALIWGYEARHPFAEETIRIQNSGTEFYVCPGTSSWNSLGGRTRNMVENISRAARHGKQTNALGLMTTDWGDNGHWQPLVASFPGFVLGAAKAWNQSRSPHLSHCLDNHVFQQKGLGDLLLATGDLDEPLALGMHNQSALFPLLREPPETIKRMQKLNPEKLEVVRAKSEELLAGLNRLESETAKNELFLSELRWVLKMLGHACQRGSAILQGKSRSHLTRRAEALCDQHQDLWFRRNRPGGYEASRALFGRLLNDG